MFCVPAIKGSFLLRVVADSVDLGQNQADVVATVEGVVVGVVGSGHRKLLGLLVTVVITSPKLALFIK